MSYIERAVRGAARRIERTSPEAADHLVHLYEELQVARVHRQNARKCATAHSESRGLKVNFGCGRARKPGFLNLDFAPTADFRLDLRRGVPLPDGSCSLVYSEHFLEHLAYPEGAELFLKECFRVLGDGGQMLLSVPDTEWPLKEYAEGGGSYIKACVEENWHPPGCTTFMEHLNYHFRQRWSGRSYSHFENHRFAWDEETMRVKLTEAGFIDVTRRGYDPAIDSAHRQNGSLFVRGRKPAKGGT
jgi:predicted SAM-dependent methyltransferase